MKKWLFTACVCLLIFTLAGCGGVEAKDIPSIIVKVDGEAIDSQKGGYEWRTEKWFTTEAVVVDAMAPNQIAVEMNAGKVKQGSVAAITFSDESKPKIRSYLWNENEREKELEVSKQTITLPSKIGRHTIEVEGIWPNGEVSYTFVVEVF